MQPDATEREAALVAELESLRQRYDMLIRAIGLMVYDYHIPTGAIRWSGETNLVCGRSYEELEGGIAQWEALLHPEDRPEAMRALETAMADMQRYDVEYRFLHKDGSYIWIFEHGYFIADPDGRAEHMFGMLQNITALKDAQSQQLRMQAEIIDAQMMALNELSTPLMPISDGTVVLPLIGSIDSRRAQQIMETLLEGVAERNAHVAIIDITGVAVVDTQVANTLIQAAQAVRLLGARVMLTGIRPEVAQTLIGLGVDLSVIDTKASLQDGIAAALDLG
ncbi:MAG: STAS domain-containing protein [Candidatus Viridilinea halotolerans]|uniref:STAS domain-containing protein n=1 Tax=Candidatus Viridilinea halotolerans TaxID=2491704 RepID=A0A426UB39_9CHLR|nr:MAG: STAS domain-containing protein [Candidatus Viridilinea halotolerans]